MKYSAARVVSRVGVTLLACAIAALLAPPRAAGDGGAVRLLQAAGPFTITLFAAPAVLGVGPADLSVLVQSRPDGAPVLDAGVAITAVPPAGATTAPVTVDATHDAATNKLLYAATVTLPVPGNWTARVAVRRAAERAEVSCELPVVAAAGTLARIWPYLTIPPLAVSLFALHQWLVARRRPPAPA
jgi:hypothetical protein